MKKCLFITYSKVNSSNSVYLLHHWSLLYLHIFFFFFFNIGHSFLLTIVQEQPFFPYAKASTVSNIKFTSWQLRRPALCSYLLTLFAEAILWQIVWLLTLKVVHDIPIRPLLLIFVSLAMWDRTLPCGWAHCMHGISFHFFSGSSISHTGHTANTVGSTLEEASFNIVLACVNHREETLRSCLMSSGNPATKMYCPVMLL